MKLGAITGLKREASCLAEPSGTDKVVVACSGADPDRAEDHARRLLEKGCSALVSFGLAGGLEPALVAGDLVVPRHVVDDKGVAFPIASNWHTRLVEALPKNGTVSEDPLFGSDRLLSTVAAKSAMREATGATAVDMESHRVARVAADAGVPFMCVRAISDDASSALPDWIAGAVNPDGSTRYTSVLKGLILNPSEFGRLIRLSRDSKTAFATLRRVAGRAGPLLRFA